jgi:hypothetical protein
MSEPDNLVLVLLREMRAEMGTRFSSVDDCLQGLEVRLDALEPRFDKIERRLEMMHANGDKALRQFIGHRAMVERSMASFEVEMREVKRRLELLEAAPS